MCRSPRAPSVSTVALIPHAFAEATATREGAAGREWLDELPTILDEACRRWRRRPSGDVWHGEVALVLAVEHPSGPAVLKASFPHEGNRGEATALEVFDGRGAVRLIDADESRLVLLLERAEPLSLDDAVASSATSVDAALHIAGDLAQQLARTAPPGTTTLASTMGPWEEQLDGQLRAVPGLVSPAAVARARETMHHLALDRTSTMLHGDLHFGNILRARRQPWLAIDPKGWSGTLAWDAFTVVCGRRDELQQVGDLRRSIRRRVHRFSTAAGADTDLAIACCQARAVSSYLYQHLVPGSWFDLDLLRQLAEHG